MSYFLVWLQDDQVLHVRDYSDSNINIAYRAFDEFQLNPLIVAVELFDDAHDSLHARVLATKKWLKSGILNEGVPS